MCGGGDGEEEVREEEQSGNMEWQKVCVKGGNREEMWNPGGTAEGGERV